MGRAQTSSLHVCTVRSFASPHLTHTVLCSDWCVSLWYQGPRGAEAPRHHAALALTQRSFPEKHCLCMSGTVDMNWFPWALVQGHAARRCLWMKTRMKLSCEGVGCSCNLSNCFCVSFSGDSFTQFRFSEEKDWEVDSASQVNLGQIRLHWRCTAVKKQRDDDGESSERRSLRRLLQLDDCTEKLQRLNTARCDNLRFNNLLMTTACILISYDGEGVVLICSLSLGLGWDLSSLVTSKPDHVGGSFLHHLTSMTLWVTNCPALSHHVRQH